MPITNPRWLIDGVPASSFVYGRKAELVVDVHNFAGGELIFKLNKLGPSLPLDTKSVSVPSVGTTPTAVATTVTLAYQWKVLADYPTAYSHFNACCDAETTLPYKTSESFLQHEVGNDLLFPPLFFTVAEPGGASVTSPTIRREVPEYVPGNKVELLVDGNEIQASVLQAIAAAQHHIHIDWFFFDTKSRIAAALIAARARGVEVRLLFDQLATATPEPLGQGIKPGAFLEGIAEMEAAGVLIGASSLALAPLDNLRTVTDPEYRDRLDIQKEYAKALMLTHGGVIAVRTLLNLNRAKLFGKLPGFIVDTYNDVGAFGAGGIGTPVLLGGCRDHTKLVIVDGTIAFCGGANAQRYYLYDKPISPTRDATDEMNDPANTEKWLKWHDSFARYEGPAVRGSQRFFVERWAVCTGEYLNRASSSYFPAPASIGSASIKVISNIPGLERDISAEYLRMFRNSTTKILIENP